VIDRSPPSHLHYPSNLKNELKKNLSSLKNEKIKIKIKIGE
jgi:hypothetical protein